MRSKYKSDLRVHTAAALVRVRTLIDMSRHVDTRRHVVARSHRSVARVLQVHGWTLALPFKAFNAQQETSARSLARARALKRTFALALALALHLNQSLLSCSCPLVDSSSLSALHPSLRRRCNAYGARLPQGVVTERSPPQKTQIPRHRERTIDTNATHCHVITMSPGPGPTLPPSRFIFPTRPRHNAAHARKHSSVGHTHHAHRARRDRHLSCRRHGCQDRHHDPRRVHHRQTSRHAPPGAA